jgi:hypothetical protein
VTSPLDVDDLRPRVQKAVDDFIAAQRYILDGVRL